MCPFRAEHKADNTSHVEMSKTVRLDSILYQSGENFLYCVYEWWLISKGEGASATPHPPLNEALHVRSLQAGNTHA